MFCFKPVPNFNSSWLFICSFQCFVTHLFPAFYTNNFFNFLFFHLILALVTSVLRTFQAHACDGQSLQLNCKPDTVINILFAQYVFANNQVCSTNSTVLNGDKPKNCTESLRVNKFF